MPSQTPPLFILDDLIRRGRLDAARRGLHEMVKRRTPRAQVAGLARLAWRLKDWRLGVRLLHPIVRPSHRKVSDATDEERTLYAACLVGGGATDEGLDLLEAIEDKKNPEVLFFRAAALISRWEYAAAIPVLEKYVASASLSAYEKLVGQVNLAAALVNGRRHSEAAALIEKLSEKTQKEKLGRLYASLLELSAVNALLHGDFTEAERALSRAEKLIGTEAALDAFFIKKWRAVLAVRRDGTPAAYRALAQVRADARARGHWETLRNCDHFEAIERKDRDLLLRVYAGTPYESLREGMIEDFGSEIVLPESVTRRFESGKPLGNLNLMTGVESEGRAKLKPGKGVHVLLAVLLSDFYQPFRVPSLHARLFPGEHYNPESSPLRVRQAIRRLRRWLEESEIPLEIVENAFAYHLEATKPYEVTLPLETHTADRLEWIAVRLRTACGDEAFTPEQAADALNLSPRSVRRLIAALVERGTLAKAAGGRGARYRLADTAERSVA